MPSFKITNTSAYRPEQMYAIAADVERYPEFIKLIRVARLSDLKRHADGTQTCRSEIEVVYKKLNVHQSFASDVTLDPNALTIRSVSNEKPMKHLDSRWVFRALPEGGSAVDYAVDYELSSRVLQFVMNKSFDYAMQKMVEAFEKRARALYGPPLAKQA